MKKSKNVKEQKKKPLLYQKKLYTTFIVSLLISFLIAMAAFLIYTKYNMEKRERQNMQNVLESVSQNIEMTFMEIADVSSVFYSQSDVFKEAECLNNPRLYQYYDELTRSEMENNYSEIITKMIHTTSQSVRSVVFFPINASSQGGYYIGKASSVLTKIIYPAYHEEEWFKEAVQLEDESVFLEPHIPSYYSNKKFGKVYSCVSAIRDRDNKKVIGVVKIDADVEQMQELLNVLGDSSKQGILLIKDGGIFMKSDSLVSKEEFENGRYQKESQSVPGTQMELTYLYSKTSFYKGYLLVTGFAILIILAGALLSFEIYRRQTKEMIEDVRHITEVMERVGQGNLDTRIEIQSQNEIGEIAEVINRMMENLKDYIEQKYLLVIQNQKAEYRALQSQINPHFLYNTLNGFVALNRMGEKKVLEKSIISLSQLFRYTCKAQESVDVESELQFLEEYLKLEKLKYEERLEYMIWMDDECRKKSIPKLLLQPIVENSIVHGMGITDQPILIKISAISQTIEEIGKVMVISIRDNGCGFDSRENEKNGNSIGINNIKERAELFCKDVIFQMNSEKGKGTKTTFVFPEKEESR